MTRNHFSKHGGPMFVNHGFSAHDHSHDDPEDIKPDKVLFFSITIGFVLMLTVIVAILSAL
jgi:hypothetical protein